MKEKGNTAYTKELEKFILENDTEAVRNLLKEIGNERSYGILYNSNILEIAICEGNPEIVKLIADINPNSSKRTESILSVALRYGDKEIVKTILDKTHTSAIERIFSSGSKSDRMFKRYFKDMLIERIPFDKIIGNNSYCSPLYMAINVDKDPISVKLMLDKIPEDYLSKNNNNNLNFLKQQANKKPEIPEITDLIRNKIHDYNKNNVKKFDFSKLLKPREIKENKERDSFSYELL